MLLLQDIFDIDVDKTTDYYDPVPGLLRFWGWGLDRQLSPRALAHVTELEARIEELSKPENQLPFVMGVKDLEPDHITDLKLHLRGSPNNLGAPVPRHFPQRALQSRRTTLAGGQRQTSVRRSRRRPSADRARDRQSRLALALRHRPGPRTASNFGTMGERPSHPALLEYLAARFVEEDFSLKWLHREILRSTTYRLASTQVARNHKRDPDNRLYWRGNRRRLDAESMRDAMLAASGTLDRKVGGRSLDLGDEDKQAAHHLQQGQSAFSPTPTCRPSTSPTPTSPPKSASSPTYRCRTCTS